MKATLEDWIPKILAAQHPDGYLQTAFTLRDACAETPEPLGPTAWSDVARGRGNHEGYVAGYFIESAINHYTMTGGKDARLYNAAKKLADCWADQHRPGAEAGVVRRASGDGAGARPVRPLRQRDRRAASRDSATSAGEVPAGLPQGRQRVRPEPPARLQQYEAVGHAVRAVYTYSGMADVAVETHDVDYQSAVKSLWDNIVHRKYYVTGGVGSGETSEGFGPNYSLRNNAYCETCSSCGEIFFQWKMHLAYHDAQYADLYEQTLYNALLGALDLDGQELLLRQPARRERARVPLAQLPVLRRQHPAHGADAADVDVLRRAPTAST